MVESAIVLYKNKEIVSIDVGGPVSVEFDFMKIWEFKNSNPFFNSNLLSFYHIHPIGFDTYSSTDLDCMKGFEIAFGNPVFFAIINFKNEDINDLEYTLNCYSLDKQKVINVAPIYSLKDEHLLLLKYLSFHGKLDKNALVSPMLFLED